MLWRIIPTDSIPVGNFVCGSLIDFFLNSNISFQSLISYLSGCVSRIPCRSLSVSLLISFYLYDYLFLSFCLFLFISQNISFCLSDYISVSLWLSLTISLTISFCFSVYSCLCLPYFLFCISNDLFLSFSIFFCISYYLSLRLSDFSLGIFLNISFFHSQSLLFCLSHFL